MRTVNIISYNTIKRYGSYKTYGEYLVICLKMLQTNKLCTLNDLDMYTLNFIDDELYGLILANQAVKQFDLLIKNHNYNICHYRN